MNIPQGPGYTPGFMPKPPYQGAPGMPGPRPPGAPFPPGGPGGHSNGAPPPGPPGLGGMPHTGPVSNQAAPYGNPPTDQLNRVNLGPPGMGGPLGGPLGGPPPSGPIQPAQPMKQPGFGPPGMGGPGMGPPSMGPPPPGMPPGPGIGPPGVGPPSMGHMGRPGGPPPLGPPGTMGPPPVLGMPGSGPPSRGGPPMGMPPPYTNGAPTPPGGMMGPPAMQAGMPPSANGHSYGPPPMGPPGMPGSLGHPQHLPGPPGKPGPPNMPPPIGHSGAPGHQHQQQMQRQRLQSSDRIDPSQIPRPATTPTKEVFFETREGGAHVAPPAASSRFIVRDRGDAGPRYMRSSLNQVPFTNELLNNSSVPFSVVVSPMALPDPADDRLQIVDCGPTGPVRCTRCKAYMNPFVKWTSQGRSFQCNFCGASNQTPDSYFAHLGPDGRRRDAEERPELCRGSVEYVATAEYSIRPAMQPAHFFVVDASQHAVATGAFATACSAISRVLDDMPYPERTLVGLATFDTVLHFYSLRPGASQAQMLVVADTQEVFAPDSAPLLVPLNDCRSALQDLLKALPEMWASQRVTDNAAGAAIEAAVAVLRSNGGKVHAFLSALPSAGIHALKVRDMGASTTDTQKLIILTSADNTMKSLAASAADFQVAIDVALMAQGYMDIATLSDLVANTGGTLYQYTPFNPAMDHDQVLNDLKWNLARPQAMEAIMRVRCSQGLDVQSYTGHFFRQPSNPTDVYLPAIDSDKAILASIAITEKLSPGHECFLQAALLYTALDGQRRIRVHTLALPITDSISTVFKGADLDTYTLQLSRKVAGALPGGTLAGLRDTVTNGVVATLHAYRKYCAANSSEVQLILPEALKLLPLHALALLKGPGLKDGAKPDDRSAWCASMLSLPAARVTPLLYPRLIPFHQLLEAGGLAKVGGLQDGLVASSESLGAGGVYLLENGRDALLYLDKAVDTQLLQDLLGMGSYDELMRAPANLSLVPRDSRASAELHELLTQVRIHRSSFMRLRIARKGDIAESTFFSALVEDRSTAGLSYIEFLCHVHRLIQDKMSKH